MVPEIEAWQTEFLYFGVFFLFYPIHNPKNQNFEKWKKEPGDIIILQMCPKNHGHMLYCSWEMARGRCNFYFSFWAIFCLLTPLTAPKIKIFKKIQKCLEISSVYTCVPKIVIRWCMVWWSDDVGYDDQMMYDMVPDRQMEKKVTYTGGCPT